jgi:hypothetical protein
MFTFYFKKLSFLLFVIDISHCLINIINSTNGLFPKDLSFLPFVNHGQHLHSLYKSNHSVFELIYSLFASKYDDLMTQDCCGF